MGELEEKLLSFHVIIIAAAAWLILWVLRKIWTGLDNINIVKKLKPIYPVILCEGFVWIPGILPDATMGERILLAIWAGFLAAIGYQLIRRFLKPHGIDLPDNPDELAVTFKKEEVEASLPVKQEQKVDKIE